MNGGSKRTFSSAESTSALRPKLSDLLQLFGIGSQPCMPLALHADNELLMSCEAHLYACRSDIKFVKVAGRPIRESIPAVDGHGFMWYNSA